MTWTWLTPPRGLPGLQGPQGPAGPPGPGAQSCIDFSINSQADLDTVAPPVGNVHTLPTDGAYCFGAFTMTSQRQIVVPNGRKVMLVGHGTSSQVSGAVDNGPLFLLQAN